MVTYLIAEHPDMTRKEAFQISKEMMRGQKMDTFVLDLSLIAMLHLSWSLVDKSNYPYFFTRAYGRANL